MRMRKVEPFEPRHMALELSLKMSTNEAGTRARTPPTVVFTPVSVHNVARSVVTT